MLVKEATGGQLQYRISWCQWCFISSLGWDTVGVCYGYFCMEYFFGSWQHCLNVHRFHKKKLPLYSERYNVQNSMRFETIPNFYTDNGNFKHSEYPFIHIAVLLAVHVLLSWEFLVKEQCMNVIVMEIYILVHQWMKIPGYTSVKLKTTFFDFIFTVPFTLSSWLWFC